jgi:hypothetical protein
MKKNINEREQVDTTLNSRKNQRMNDEINFALRTQ